MFVLLSPVFSLSTLANYVISRMAIGTDKCASALPSTGGVYHKGLVPLCNSNESNKRVAYPPSAHCASHRGKKLSLWHLGCTSTVMIKCNAIIYDDLKLSFLRHQNCPQNISLFTNAYLLELDYAYDGLLDGYPENMRHFELSKQILPRHHSKTRHNEQNIAFPKH